MANISSYIKLSKVQNEIEVPKKHKAPDGNYCYYKLGDIYKALEPLKTKYNFMCTSSEDIVCVGNKLYVKSTVSFVDLDLNDDNIITATALARECTYNNSGMAESQQTGSATTYARKNSYNALLGLEDEENIDPDTQQGTNPDVILNNIEYIPTVEEAAAVLVEYKPDVKIKNTSLLGKPLGTLPKNMIMNLSTSKKVTPRVAKAAEVLLKQQIQQAG